MSELDYDDDHIRSILGSVKTIAMIGASPKAERPSNRVLRFRVDKGYTVHPVNPGYAGKEIHGRTVYASLPEVPAPIDMVDIFRASDVAGQVADKAVALAAEKGIKVVWMQLGIRNDEAAARAEAAGLTVIMNRCPRIEHPRLFPG